MRSAHAGIESDLGSALDRETTTPGISAIPTTTAPATTTNGAVSGAGNVVNTSAPTQSTSTGSAPSASSSSTSTSNATATAINDIDILLPSFLAGATIKGNNNIIIGDNNNLVRGNHNTINTSTTNAT